MDILKDFLMINKQTFKKTVSSLKNNWIIIFSGIVYMILNTIMIILINTFLRGILGILSGLAIAIVTASLISNYLYLLYNVINYDSLKLQDFKDGFTYFLRKVYTIFFYGFILNILISLLSGVLGSYADVLSLIVNISILILLNPLPETLYIKVLNPMDSIAYSIDFMKENWVNWFIPNVIMLILLYLLTGNLISGIFTTHISYIRSFRIIDIILYLIASAFLSFIMIYRGHLYKLLSTSTRRKRMYMSKF